MAAERVTKSACCRRFGWTRYQFDKNVTAGMPVAEAAGHKGAEWRVDPRAVARWLAEREAHEAARRRRFQERYAEQQREAARAAEAILARKHGRERAQRDAAKRREAEWRERETRRQMERWLDRAYGIPRRVRRG
jgi:phage terminase Nu1 subunit (DNA packaging protein)